MVLGRCVFGVGMSSMIFAQVAFITEWFIGKNLNLALGVVSSLPLFGTVANASFTPRIYNDHRA